MSADEKTRKTAYRYVANAIDEFLTDYAMSDDPLDPDIDPLVRVEMERIRDSMLAAGEVPATDRNGANGAVT